jgi:hypothetical protein
MQNEPAPEVGEAQEQAELKNGDRGRRKLVHKKGEQINSRQG